MITKKKNLIERVRIVFTVLITILGFGGAMAVQGGAKQADQSYRYISQTSGHYIVQQAPLTDGTYRCNDAQTICTVQSSSSPQMDGTQYKLNKNDASVSLGTFQSTN